LRTKDKRFASEIFLIKDINKIDAILLHPLRGEASNINTEN